MKIPYHFDFNGDVKYRTVLSSLPDWCTYTMPTAKCRLYYLWNGTGILSQQLNYTPFFTEMIEVDIEENTHIPFVVEDRQILLLFMMSGEVTFLAPDGNPIVTLGNNTFMISEFGSGRYSFEAEKGKHIGFLVNIQREWFEKMEVEFPTILTRIREEQANPFHMLPQHRIGKTIKNWLKKIYEYSETNIGAVDGNQRKYICFILAYYDTRISEGNSMLAEHLKQFVEENYLDPELNVQSIADHFYLTRQTLRNHFYRKFNRNIQEFLTSLRMQRAQRLIDEEGLDKNKVFDQVGYLDYSSFRKAYKRYTDTDK